MMDPIVLAYGKGQMTGFLADPRGVLDVVSAYFHSNAITDDREYFCGSKKE